MVKKISAKDVQALREKTGVGMMEAKSALSEAGGNVNQALEILRKKDQLKADKRAGRVTRQGVIDAYVHGEGRIGVLVEVNSETDFVARNQEFRKLVHDLALHIVAQAPLYISRDKVPVEVIEKEKAVYAEMAMVEGKPGGIVEKIVSGRLEKFFQEVCLMEQPFVRDQDITVQELINQKIAILGENIQVRRFVRFAVGE